MHLPFAAIGLAAPWDHSTFLPLPAAWQTDGKALAERYHKLVAELLTATREPHIGIGDAFLAGRGAGGGERRDAGLEE